MGRRAKPKCEWDDCFTCPYEDCIDTNKFDSSDLHTRDYQKKRGPGRPRLPDGVVHQHQLEYARQHYQDIKEQRSVYYKDYYQKNKDRIKAQQKEYRERRKKGL